ncbi:MAG: ribonuclease P protein component [Candidatus Shikimatogenerans sp. Ttur]|uniref:Ribonuclease P protein component n=1 Tax=Candidatus Shikimatogenerans sp. Ttur TaxID=3158569 RepID=A0AAU7ZXZ4_9FLAO
MKYFKLKKKNKIKNKKYIYKLYNNKNLFYKNDFFNFYIKKNIFFKINFLIFKKINNSILRNKIKRIIKHILQEYLYILKNKKYSILIILYNINFNYVNYNLFKKKIINFLKYYFLK